MGGSSFAPAFFLLPAERRRALFSLHAFCRAADDAVDSGDGDAVEAERRLGVIREEVAALYGDGTPRLPETIDLAPHIEPYKLQREHLERLLDALARDIDGPVIDTEADLTSYCEGVAAAPGHLSLAIFDCPEAGAYADTLGLALQCTNILRDLRQDLLVERLYLPLEDLREFGTDRETLISQARESTAIDEPTHKLIGKHRRRTLRWFEAAGEAYRTQPSATRGRLVAARGMQRIYRNLFDRLCALEPMPRERLRTDKLRAVTALIASWSEAHLGGR